MYPSSRIFTNSSVNSPSNVSAATRQLLLQLSNEEKELSNGTRNIGRPLSVSGVTSIYVNSSSSSGSGSGSVSSSSRRFNKSYNDEKNPLFTPFAYPQATTAPILFTQRTGTNKQRATDVDHHAAYVFLHLYVVMFGGFVCVCMCVCVCVCVCVC